MTRREMQHAMLMDDLNNLERIAKSLNSISIKYIVENMRSIMTEYEYIINEKEKQ